jgi:hypothetical protein
MAFWFMPSSTAPTSKTAMALQDIRSSFPWLRHVFADGGYAGDKLRKALTKIGG